MDIKNFLEPVQQFGQHFQEVPDKARQFVEQHAPAINCSSMLGS